ncbi:MAG: hypothetical protein HQ495_10990 [Alphaproteobacteria bacterium]|nr:hypothetical protein [Alphaproteobacteria bacterium]
MKIRLAITAAFALGLAAGILGTSSWGPQAAEAPRLAASDIENLGDFVREIVEECVIAGAGSTLARITCHME